MEITQGTRSAAERLSAGVSPATRHIPELDGLRCVAVVLVVASHAVTPAHYGGEIGVDIFFVLSGYLISTLIVAQVESGAFRLLHFYAKRMIRLAPALLLTAVVALPFGLAVVQERGRFVEEVVTAAFYLTPITKTLFGISGSFGHAWTLGMEEYFYLAWPPVILIARRLRLSAKVLCLSVLGTGLFGYLFKFAADPTHAAPLGLLRVSGIALGCALALFLRGREGRVPVPSTLLTVGLVALVVLSFMAGDGPFANLVYPLVCCVTCITTAGIVGGGTGLFGRVLVSRPVVYVGLVSYEIYLVHYPLLVLGAEAVGHDGEWRRVAWWTIPLAFIIAALIHETVKPLQGRMRAWLTSKGS